MTNRYVDELGIIVAASPVHSTPKMAEAAVAVFMAYQACAAAYLARGNFHRYVYAIDRGVEMYEFAAQAYGQLGETQTSIRILENGLENVDSALRTADPVTAHFQDDLRSHRNTMTMLLSKFRRMML